MCGCSSSSHSELPVTPENDETLLNISGELSFNGIAFLYQITEHNANIADKKRFTVSIEDDKAESVIPDNNGAFAFPPTQPRRHFTVFAKNIAHPNLVFEATDAPDLSTYRYTCLPSRYFQS